ncbi:MAG: protein-disulfide isomerase [Candidatus Saccharimonadales bacterium]
MKQIIITVLVIAGIIAAAMLISGSDDVAGVESNNFYGPENGVITLTEYGDFECPACAGFFPYVSLVKEAFKDQVRFEFKHFPLVQIHQNAIAAHRAAQAASNQGMFWEMHDLLYEGQATWRSSGQTSPTGAPISNNPSGVFEEYARLLDLDLDLYIADVRNSETLGIINADIDAGKTLGAESTPTFYLDGVLIEDLNSLIGPDTGQGVNITAFSSFLQNAIDEKNAEAAEAPTEEAVTETSEPAAEDPQAKEEDATN